MIHDFRLISDKSDKTLLFGVGLLKAALLLPVAEDFFQKKRTADPQPAVLFSFSSTR
jgi:hypothetical protein